MRGNMTPEEFAAFLKEHSPTKKYKHDHCTVYSFELGQRQTKTKVYDKSATIWDYGNSNICYAEREIGYSFMWTVGGPRDQSWSIDDRNDYHQFNRASLGAPRVILIHESLLEGGCR